MPWDSKGIPSASVGVLIAGPQLEWSLMSSLLLLLLQAQFLQLHPAMKVATLWDLLAH